MKFQMTGQNKFMTVYFCFSPSRVILPLSKHLQSKIIASEATGGFVINDGI